MKDKTYADLMRDILTDAAAGKDLKRLSKRANKLMSDFVDEMVAEYVEDGTLIDPEICPQCAAEGVPLPHY